MPVQFLTDEQAERYGRYTGEVTTAQLSRFFHLDDTDRAFIEQRRGVENRLGFAVQLCTVRFLGTFIENPSQVPDNVVDHLAAQLGIPDPEKTLPRYLARPQTYRAHRLQIQQALGYKTFNAALEGWRLVRWLYTRAWRTAERASVLFDLATARLVEQKILLPGVNVLARLVARVRDAAENRLWEGLSQIPSPVQRERLEALLVVPSWDHCSHLERLRRPPVRVSGPALVNALTRFETLRDIGLHAAALERFPFGRIKALARYCALASTYDIARMADDKRVATLVAFVAIYEMVALDEALDVLNLLMGEMLGQAVRERDKERLRTIRALDGAALRLRDVCATLVDDECAAELVRETVFARIPRKSILQAMSTIERIARPDEDDYFKELGNKHSRARRFLPKLLGTVEFHSAPAGQSVKRALEFLASLEGKNRPSFSEAPLDVIPKRWLQHVASETGDVDRSAYTICVLERLHDALQRRDVFVSPSERWGDPRLKLMRGEEWEAARPTVCRTLCLAPSAKREVESLGRMLDDAYRRTVANLPANTSVRIEREKGKDVVILTGLERVDEPPSLLALREAVTTLLPSVDLPEILMEMNVRTGFASEFTHISEGKSRARDLDVSICAVLLATACNVGFEPLIHQGIPALTRERLSWVQQNYIRAETIVRANARLVEAQTQIALAQCWGGGEVASADGLRFVVPVRSVNAGANPKYFGVGRGITYYNFTSDQFTGFHGIVIPGTMRDSLYILDGLLEHQTCLNPNEIMADTAGSSEIVFALFWLLGFQFSPRLADIGRLRFWRMEPSADYGPLDQLARNRVNVDLIANNWDDILRVAGSLREGTISASELIRSLLRGPRPSTLSRALRELGRVPKTLHMLMYIDDEAFRRRVLTQLNRGEARHSLARVICHGHRGQILQRYREGQEDQLGCLGLVLNAVVLWNTIYMNRIVEHLRMTGVEMAPEDLERLSPLGYENINFLGRYSFELPDALKRGHYRPLLPRS